MRLGSNVRMCATCAYWQGMRSFVDFGVAVEVVRAEPGRCGYPKKFGAPAQATDLCQFFEKAPVLR